MSKKVGKVKCRVCSNEEAGFCNVKKTAVKLNKARHCEAFIMAPDKIKVSIKPKSVMRPDWYWNKKEYIKFVKEEFAKQQAAEEAARVRKESLAKPDVLSNFRSTATKEE